MADHPDPDFDDSTDDFEDAESDDGPDDSVALEAYAAEVVEAVEAFGVPVPDDGTDT